MLLQCPACQSAYRIELASLPAGQKHIKCKKCQTPIRVTSSSTEQPALPKNTQEAKVSIQCNNCGTKYRVKQSRLSDKVSKVKCTKCNSIFKIQGLAHTNDPSPQNSGSQQSSEVPSSVLSDAEKAYFQAVEIVPGKTDDLPEIPLDEFEKNELFLAPDAPLSKQATTQESQKLPEVDPELMELSELPSSSSSPSQPANPADDKTNTSFASDPGVPEESDQSANPFPSQRSTLPIVEETPLDNSTNWGKLTVILLIFMVIFLGIAGAGAYLALKEPSLLNQIMNTAQHPVKFSGKLVNRRIKNFPSRQTLVVIEGKLQNLMPTSDQVSWIRLKGLAFDENRQILETSMVYAGNILTQKELSSMGLDKIKKFYKYNSGRNNSNFELKENQEVPFQIVFFDSANLLKNVTVTPVSYVRQDETIYVRSGEE